MLVFVRYHLMVEGDRGDGVDHVEIPSMPGQTGRFGTGTNPLLAPGVKSQTLSTNWTYCAHRLGQRFSLQYLCVVAIVIEVIEHCIMFYCIRSPPI